VLATHYFYQSNVLQIKRVLITQKKTLNKLNLIIMKKAFLFFSGILVVVSFTSCSSDDLNTSVYSSENTQNITNSIENTYEFTTVTNDSLDTDPIIIIKKD
jgi:hypothetical protein